MIENQGGSWYTDFSLSDIFDIKRKLARDPKIRIVEPLGNSNTFMTKPIDFDDPRSSTVWVVSPGNSGSSLLHDSLRKSSSYTTFKSHSFPIKWKSKSCIKGTCHGGHLWEIEESDKIIYLYSHPLNIVLSFCEKININYEDWAHGNPHYVEFLECDTDEDFNDNYLFKDVLNLERHLDKWWRQNDFDILCVKYEKLYECQDIIEKFIGNSTEENHLNLPPYRSRKTDWEKHPNKGQLLQTYASVIEKFEQKPDYEFFQRRTNDI
tara:strand:+ start:69 stop:863 length:795 start_codon:yes stop_codon:yes gene_type:complete